MGSQPNLASMSEVVSIYKCPLPKIGGPSPKFGAQKNIKFLTAFFATFALDTAYLRNETSYRQTKMLVLIYNVSPKSGLTFRDLWPRNGWDSFRHYDPPYENSAFSSTGFPHKGHWTQVNQILPDVGGLNEFTIHRKNLGKIRLQKIRSYISWNFWPTRFSRLPHFLTRPRISPEWNVASTKQNTSINLQCVP